MNFEELYYYEDNSFSVKNEQIYIRVLDSGLLQFGFKSTFDRWANSVDFETKIPNSKEEFIKIYDELLSLKRCRQKIGMLNKNKPYYCSSWISPNLFKNNKGFCQSCIDRKHKKAKEKNKKTTRRKS